MIGLLRVAVDGPRAVRCVDLSMSTHRCLGGRRTAWFAPARLPEGGSSVGPALLGGLAGDARVGRRTVISQRMVAMVRRSRVMSRPRPLARYRCRPATTQLGGGAGEVFVDYAQDLGCGAAGGCGVAECA
jgi:hypothetical protein